MHLHKALRALVWISTSEQLLAISCDPAKSVSKKVAESGDIQWQYNSSKLHIPTAETQPMAGSSFWFCVLTN